MTLTQGSTFITPLRLSVNSVHILFTIQKYNRQRQDGPFNNEHSQRIVHAINFVPAVLQQSVLTWLLQKYTMIIVSGVYAQFFAHNLEYR